MIYFEPSNFRERILRKIVDQRITDTNTVDILGKSCNSLITIIHYGQWKKAIFILKRRIK